MKKSYQTIVIIILLILTLGLSGYIIYDKLLTGNNDIKVNEKENEVINYEEINEQCFSPYNQSNYGENEVWKFTLNGILLNNTKNSFLYEKNESLGKTLMKLNDKIIYEETSDERVLYQICVYDDYLITSQNWEGQGTNHIFDYEGNLDYEFYGLYKYNNNKLEVSSIEENEKVYIKSYEIDLSQKELIKSNFEKESIACENLTEEDQYKEDNISILKRQYCYGP